jgi:hypothetical protein
MTGMYLLVGTNGAFSPQAYMQQIHTQIARTLLKLISDGKAEPEVISAAQLALDYIEKYAPEVYFSAVNQSQQSNSHC